MSDHLSPETVFRALEFGIFHDESNLKVYLFVIDFIVLLFISTL